MHYGRIKPLSNREIKVLERNGRLDGIKGLPKEDENGIWTSAFIEGEVHSCQEKCNMLWGSLQISMEKTYAEMDSIVDKIVKNRRRLEDLENDITVNSNPEVLRARKNGEEALAESIVIARRRKEQERIVQPMKTEKARLIAINDSLYERLAGLRGIAKEATTAVKINTQRLEEHTGQRINAYWNAAFDKHPAKSEMPPMFKVSISCTGEHTYVEGHQNIEDKVIDLLSSRNEYHDKSESKEVA